MLLFCPEHIKAFEVITVDWWLPVTTLLNTHLRNLNLNQKVDMHSGCYLFNSVKVCLFFSSQECFNFRTVWWVQNDKVEILSQFMFWKLVQTIKLLPELFLNWLGCLSVELNVVEAQCWKNTASCLITGIILKVLKLAQFSRNKEGESRGSV